MHLRNLVPLILLLSACSSPVDGMTTGTGPGITTRSAVPATVLPATAPVSLSSGVLNLTILSPLDGSVTDQARIYLDGSVSVDTVLSVNEEIFILPPGNFSIPVTLEDGPNTLDIVASDLLGNEVDLILVVTYQP